MGAAHHRDSAINGLAHVMLPGESRGQDPSVTTKYAEDALKEMMQMMSDLGATEARVHVCLMGGGHDSPGPDIVRSLTEILGRKGITPVRRKLAALREEVAHWIWRAGAQHGWWAIRSSARFWK